MSTLTNAFRTILTSAKMLNATTLDEIRHAHDTCVCADYKKVRFSIGSAIDEFNSSGMDHLMVSRLLIACWADITASQEFISILLIDTHALDNHPRTKELRGMVANSMHLIIPIVNRMNSRQFNRIMDTHYNVFAWAGEINMDFPPRMADYLVMRRLKIAS